MLCQGGCLTCECLWWRPQAQFTSTLFKSKRSTAWKLYINYNPKPTSHSISTCKQSTSAIHYQPHYLFLLKCKAFTSAVHYYLPLSISFDMQSVPISNLLSFALKFTSTRIMISTSARHIIHYGYNFHNYANKSIHILYHVTTLPTLYI